MSLRQEKSYSLVVKGDIHDEKLPPLILHTLIENGLTHGYEGKDSGIFKLTFNRKNENVTITIFNDSNIAHNNTVTRDGTGLRYIKSRMEETFSNMWTLSSNAVPGGWEVIIKYEEK
jgi:LytS/YehU family sensor histidine kinase